jgi:hypothetical protein
VLPIYLNASSAPHGGTQVVGEPFSQPQSPTAGAQTEPGPVSATQSASVLQETQEANSMSPQIVASLPARQ